MNDGGPIHVLYDADCGFCNWCRAFVEKRDKKRKFIFHGIASNEVDFLFETRNISVDRINPESIAMVLPDAVLYKGTATGFVLKNMPFPWNFAGRIFLLLPTFLIDRLYDSASRNRGVLCRLVRCSK
jgi:predicted DCC family thiol-disulfide oxidoreductase YuxK